MNDKKAAARKWRRFDNGRALCYSTGGHKGRVRDKSDGGKRYGHQNEDRRMDRLVAPAVPHGRDSAVPSRDSPGLASG